MEYNMEKEIKLRNNIVYVKVKLQPHIRGTKKHRMYTSAARQLACEQYPMLDIGEARQAFTLANYNSDQLEGEWSFEVKETESTVKELDVFNEQEEVLEKTAEKKVKGKTSNKNNKVL
jgi:hypothetical protein